ncbi:MAG TPA: hypothetical protein VF801_07570 [Rhodocyclaceae bacterium]
MTAEENYRFLQEMDANRRFMLAAYRDNPSLLAKAEPRIRAWLTAVEASRGDIAAQPAPRAE